MKEDLEIAMRNLTSATGRLREGVESATDALDRDGVIQGFEFTFELLWKTLKLLMESEGVRCTTPRECLKAAFRWGLIHDEQAALDLLDSRNRMSHTYSEQDALRVYEEIKETFLPSLH